MRVDYNITEMVIDETVAPALVRAIEANTSLRRLDVMRTHASLCVRTCLIYIHAI